MTTDSLLALFDREQRIDIEYPGVRKERRPHLIRYISETDFPHFILYSNLADADVDAVIAEEQAYFADLGEVEWKVYAHDQPPDLRQRLQTHGFEVEEPEAVMVLDLQEAPAWPAPDPAVSVRLLEDTADLEIVRRIQETVWEEDFAWLTTQLGADMQIPGYLSVYLASVNEQPASAAWIYFHPNSQFASLLGGATLAAHRGRGLYTALLATRAREAARRGYRYLTVDTSSMSQPIVARHGFRQLTTAWGCIWGHDKQVAP